MMNLFCFDCVKKQLFSNQLTEHFFLSICQISEESLLSYVRSMNLSWKSRNFKVEIPASDKHSETRGSTFWVI